MKQKILMSVAALALISPIAFAAPHPAAQAPACTGAHCDKTHHGAQHNAKHKADHKAGHKAAHKAHAQGHHKDCHGQDCHPGH